MNEIQEEYREYKKLCRVEDDPGVQGLAQLGRNAIERVTELERMLAERDADIVKLGTALISAERERDAIKGDYDEAAHFARHFIRDDPEITPRGAIIRLADKCTSLFCRLQAAERELQAVREAPAVATVVQAPGPYELRELQVKRCISHLSDSCFLPPIGTELIARPARRSDQQSHDEGEWKWMSGP